LKVFGEVSIISNKDIIIKETSLKVNSAIDGKSLSKPVKLDSKIAVGITTLVKNSGVPKTADIKDGIDNLYEIVFKPNIQEGIDRGEYLWDGASVNIRNANTKRFAGQIDVKKADLEKVFNDDKIKKAISNSTKAICTISGQMQLAEISEKLEKISNKLDFLIENEKEKIRSKLTGTIKTVNKALDLEDDNPDKRNRLNLCVRELEEMADFFKNRMNDTLDKLPEKRIIDSLIDSLKLNPSKIKDYKFSKKVNEWLNENAYYLKSYLLSHYALAKCYELLDGKSAWERDMHDCSSVYNDYTRNFSKRLVFLLKENSISMSNSTDASIVLNKITEKDEHLLIKNGLVMMKDIIDNKSNGFYVKDANCIEISYTINTQELIGGSENG
jgi:hypothetical protein